MSGGLVATVHSGPRGAMLDKRGSTFFGVWVAFSRPILSSMSERRAVATLVLLA